MQLEHSLESKSGMQLEERIACLVAKECNIPYFIPPDMVDKDNKEINDLNSGGNLEILPNGTFYMGVRKQEVREGRRITSFQKKQRALLKKNGNRVLELDVSFLVVGHVDEIVNTVKTQGDPPCNYAVLIADPVKAFELMEKGRWHRSFLFFRTKPLSEI